MNFLLLCKNVGAQARNCLPGWGLLYYDKRDRKEWGYENH